MNPARERAAALGPLVVGAALMLLAGGRVWFRARSGEAGLPSLPVDLSGRDVAAVVSAVGLLALAGAGVLLLIGGVARRVVGVVVLVGGLAAVWRCVDVVTHQAAVSSSSAAQKLSSSGPSVITRPEMSAWPWVALVGSLLVVVGAGAVAVRGGRWPDRSTRYDGPKASTAPIAPTGKASAEPVDTSDAMWKALDRGEDPTDLPAGGPDAPGEPDRS